MIGEIQVYSMESLGLERSSETLQYINSIVSYERTGVFEGYLPDGRSFIIIAPGSGSCAAFVGTPSIVEDSYQFFKGKVEMLMNENERLRKENQELRQENFWLRTADALPFDWDYDSTPWGFSAN